MNELRVMFSYITYGCYLSIFYFRLSLYRPRDLLPRRSSTRNNSVSGNYIVSSMANSKFFCLPFYLLYIRDSFTENAEEPLWVKSCGLLSAENLHSPRGLCPDAFLPHNTVPKAINSGFLKLDRNCSGW
jgi:hypothetical protein